jgi:ATP/ADP translocase
MEVVWDGRCRECAFLHPTQAVPLSEQFAWLLVLSIPVACIAWTITHEEVLREPRDYCQEQSKHARSRVRRKFFYLFTCEYCLSHYVAALFLLITRFKLLYSDWRGYLVALFALVWVANQYMSIYNRLRLDIKHEQVQIRAQEKEEPAGEQKHWPERAA